MADELLADVGVLRALRSGLFGLVTRMRANDPTTALAPVTAAMVSSEAAACVAAGPDVMGLSVLVGRVDTTSVAVGEAVTCTAAEAAFRKQLCAGLTGRFGVDPTEPGFEAHNVTSASGGAGPWLG